VRATWCRKRPTHCGASNNLATSPNYPQAERCRTVLAAPACQRLLTPRRGVSALRGARQSLQVVQVHRAPQRTHPRLDPTAPRAAAISSAYHSSDLQTTILHERSKWGASDSHQGNLSGGVSQRIEVEEWETGMKRGRAAFREGVQRRVRYGCAPRRKAHRHRGRPRLARRPSCPVAYWTPSVAGKEWLRTTTKKIPVVLGAPSRSLLPWESESCTQAAHGSRVVSGMAAGCSRAEPLERCGATAARRRHERGRSMLGGCLPHHGRVRRSPALREAAALVSGRRGRVDERRPRRPWFRPETYVK
jgi:hypothetical protein